MARKVKCRITGEVGTSDVFIKVDKYYYKSQDIYDAYIAEKELENKILDLVMLDILSYNSTSSNPSLIRKKLNELHENFSYEAIYETILAKSGVIKSTIKDKDFATQYQMIAYIFAIITNNISDIAKEIKVKQQVVRCLSDDNLEFMALALNQGNTVGKKQKQKNITHLVDN
jgi:hypothetical protein